MRVKDITVRLSLSCFLYSYGAVSCIRCHVALVYNDMARDSVPWWEFKVPATAMLSNNPGVCSMLPTLTIGPSLPSSRAVYQ